MKTRHGMGVGLVGLLLSTVAFAEAPVASEVTEEIAVAASSPEHPIVDEIIVTARRPDAEPRSVELTMQSPLDLLRETPIRAPSVADELLIEPEIRLNL